jgi:hypothetical protein
MDIDGGEPSSPAKVLGDSDTEFETQADSEEDDADDNQTVEENMAPEEKAFMQSLGWGVDCRVPTIHKHPRPN